MAWFLRRISRRLWRMDPCHFDFYCRFEVIRMNPESFVLEDEMMMAGLGILLWAWLIFELDD